MAAQGVTVFVTTHYMEEAEYCDRLALIYRGELIAVGAPEVLKHEVMTEDVLEIVCDRPESVMERIEALPSVKDVALFGTSLHLVARDGQQAEADVRRCFDEAGSAIRKIEPIAPSLEDVFVSLIEARDREIRPQEEVRR
jgi:ABC-2 type transport system ATP-binding protein